MTDILACSDRTFIASDGKSYKWVAGITTYSTIAVSRRRDDHSHRDTDFWTASSCKGMTKRRRPLRVTTDPTAV